MGRERLYAKRSEEDDLPAPAPPRPSPTATPTPARLGRVAVTRPSRDDAPIQRVRFGHLKLQMPYKHGEWRRPVDWVPTAGPGPGPGPGPIPPQPMHAPPQATPTVVQGPTTGPQHGVEHGLERFPEAWETVRQAPTNFMMVTAMREAGRLYVQEQPKLLVGWQIVYAKEIKPRLDDVFEHQYVFDDFADTLRFAAQDFTGTAVPLRKIQGPPPLKGLLAAFSAGREIKSDGFEGRFLEEDIEHPTVLAILKTAPEALRIDRGLVPADPMMLSQACRDLVSLYGNAVAIHIFAALRHAKYPLDAVSPLLHEMPAAIAKERTTTKLVLHSGAMDARQVDPTATYARALVLYGSDHSLDFSNKQKTPALDTSVALEKIPIVDSFSSLVPGKVLRYEANGRTLRCVMEGEIIALKFMREGETAAKLQRESEAFAFAKGFLKDAFPAEPREMEKGHLARVDPDTLPTDARTALFEEVKRGGLTLHDAPLVCMSYRVSGRDPGAFFEYLEDTQDDERFTGGFVHSMATLGALGAEGVFDPSLILNSYHDPSTGRSWNWAPGMVRLGRDNAGKENAQLANVKWSNLRVGGLADPEELRDIEKFDAPEELGRLTGTDKKHANISRDLAPDGPLPAPARTKLLATYLVGRTIHEALAIATRRLVGQGAFDDEVDSKRRLALTETFGRSVTGGLLAFGRTFTGAEEKLILDALQRHGIDLDRSVRGLLAERQMLFGYEHIDPMLKQDAKYFAQIFGVSPDTIEFEPNRPRPATDWVTIEYVLEGGQRLSKHLGSLTMDAKTLETIIEHGSHARVGKIDQDLDAPVEVQVPASFDVERHFAMLKREMHPHQNIGPRNGVYMFQQESRLNLIYSSVLVNLRAARGK